MRKHQIELICQWCKNKYFVQFYRKNISKYCSGTCRSKFTAKVINNTDQYRGLVKRNSLRFNLKPPPQIGKDNFNYNPDLHIPDKTLCNCGCGDYVYHPKSKPKKFIRGHNTRIRTYD